MLPGTLLVLCHRAERSSVFGFELQVIVGERDVKRDVEMQRLGRVVANLLLKSLYQSLGPGVELFMYISAEEPPNGQCARICHEQYKK